MTEHHLRARIAAEIRQGAEQHFPAAVFPAGRTIIESIARMVEEGGERPLALRPVAEVPNEYRDAEGRLWVRLREEDRYMGEVCSCGRSVVFLLVELHSPLPAAERRRCGECAVVVVGSA